MNCKYQPRFGIGFWLWMIFVVVLVGIGDIVSRLGQIIVLLERIAAK